MSLLKHAFSSDTLDSNLKLCSCPKAKFFPEIFILGSVEPKGNFRDYLAPLSPKFMDTFMLLSWISCVVFLYAFIIIKHLLSVYFVKYVF